MKRRMRALPRWLLALALACSLLCSTVFATAVPTEEEAYQAMMAMQSQYPDGMKYDNDDWYQWKGGIYNRGYGCIGFAMILSDAAFGDLPAELLTDIDYDALKVGDILRINDDTHSVIILEKYDDHVVIAQANVHINGSAAGYIRWGDEMTRSEVMEADNVMTRYTGGTIYPQIDITLRYIKDGVLDHSAKLTYTASVGTQSALYIALDNLIERMKSGQTSFVPEYEGYGAPDIMPASYDYAPGDPVEILLYYESESGGGTNNPAGHVTFRVQGGYWGVNGTDSTEKTAEITKQPDGTYTLNPALVPNVGQNPDGTHQNGGSWDVDPHTAAVTPGAVYTYTYAAKTAVASARVTFRVQGGYWGNTGTDNRTTILTLTGTAPLKLEASDIPAVGLNPDGSHQFGGTWDTVPYAGMTVTDGMVFTYTYAEKPASASARVTFQVRGGYWGTAGTDSRSVILTLTGTAPLRLTADQIPAVGQNPDSGHQSGGAWDTVPYAGMTVTDGMVFTYSYAEKPVTSARVTFRVQGGCWGNAGTDNRDIVLTLTGNAPLKLEASDIPAVGLNPDGTHQSGGAWDTVPYAGMTVTDGMVFTYTYDEKPVGASARVTFRVEGGYWGTTGTDKRSMVLTVSGTPPLTLDASYIPTVGQNPDGEHQSGGSWDTVPADGMVLSDGMVFTYTYPAKPAAVSARVTFRVSGGYWGTSGTDSRDRTVTVTGPADSPLTLSASDIPAVGQNPDGNHQSGGAWNTVPAAGTVVTDGTVFTYTYAEMPDPYADTSLVTYLPDNGTVEREEQRCDNGETLTLPANSFTAPSGKVFSGWRIGNTLYRPGDTISVTQDITVTAAWETAASRYGDADGDGNVTAADLVMWLRLAMMDRNSTDYQKLRERVGDAAFGQVANQQGRITINTIMGIARIAMGAQ